jgi:nucleoside-diphosphate-sugar epimerase
VSTLITGPLGYVGPSVVSGLRKMFGEATDLIGLDVGYFSKQRELEQQTPEEVLNRVIDLDIRDLQASHLKSVKHVVHLAAVSNDPMGDRFAAVTTDINRDQTVRLAKLAKECGVESFTFASSGSVYGAGGGDVKSETSDLNPQTAYARSKIESELALAELATDSFKVSCLRFSTACGWSPRVRLDLVLNDFVASALTVNKIEVLSDGSPWRPLIHVSDMARAVTWATSDRLHLPESFLVVNVGSHDWNYQIKDLAHAVADSIGGIEVLINSDAPADNRSYRLDFSKWESIAPNHQPIVSLNEAISDLVINLEKLTDLDSKFRSSKRIRLVELNNQISNSEIDTNLRMLKGLNS